MALNLDALSQVSGGSKMPYGGTVLHFPDNCPQCGAALIKTRGAKKLILCHINSNANHDDTSSEKNGDAVFHRHFAL